MPLTTRCRHCGRIFPVHAQQLKERRGKVECPQCGGRFGPESYLPDKAPGAGLGPGESVRPTLDLEAPAAPAAGFRVKLF
jgi:predicted Zn finger-like uncharacterized protein